MTPRAVGGPWSSARLKLAVESEEALPDLCREGPAFHGIEPIFVPLLQNWIAVALDL